MKSNLSLIRKIITALLIVVLVAMGATVFMYINSIPPKENVLYEILQTRLEIAEGVSLDGIALGGKTFEEAQVLVKQNHLNDRLSSIEIINGEKKQTLDLSSLIPTYDTEALLLEAMDYGNVGEKELRDQQKAQALASGKAFVSTPTYDLSPLKLEIARIAEELFIEPIDAQVKVKDQNDAADKAALEVEDNVDETELLAELEQEQEVTTTDADQVQTKVGLDENGNVRGLEDLFQYVDSVVGKKVDAQKLYDMIADQIANNTIVDPIIAPVDDVEPSKTLEDVRHNFTLISSFTTSFAKSPYNAKNRMFNINKAAELINGYILEPGETFSFNDVLGPRSEKKGWKSAGAINNGESVQEFGGGICQVSSTTFNAVLMADLEIVERHPHSWALSYVAAGQDATISTGGPDFRFKNAKDRPIVLVAFADLKKKTLTIQFYGEPLPNNRTIKLVSKKVASLAQPAGKVINVKTPGYSKVVSKGRGGSKWETYFEIYENDVLVETKLAYKTTYRARASVTEKGPAIPKPAPQPSNGDGGGGGGGDSDVEEIIIPLE